MFGRNVGNVVDRIRKFVLIEHKRIWNSDKTGSFEDLSNITLIHRTGLTANIRICCLLVFNFHWRYREFAVAIFDFRDAVHYYGLGTR